MRTFVVACVSGVLLMLVAAPAVAQRDPFAPRVGEPRAVETQQQDTGVFQPTGEAQPAQEAEPRPDRAPPTEPLPVTGSEAAPWLAAAYVLVALGAGAIVLAGSFGVQAKPRRG